MDHPKQRHGDHTWDMVQQYCRCSKCGYIIENRDKFTARFHRREKEVSCPRCQHVFTVSKKTKQTTFGPLLGHDLDVDE